MVSDMLFLAQVNENTLAHAGEAIDLAREADALFDFYEALAEEKQIRLNTDGDARIVCDRLMIRRAISNLLSNAIRYSPPNAPVRVSVNQGNGQIQLCVHNPGTPIAAEHLPRLFDRFYRVDPSRQRKGEGSGIGLAIVKSIVGAHHGSVAAQSDLRSTRFIVVLPKQV